MISVTDYKNTIEEYKDNVNDIYSELEDIKIVSENSSIRLNFDGTPVSWVLILKQDKETKELEAIREELMQNGFNSFIFNEMLMLDLILIGLNLRRLDNCSKRNSV